MKSHPVLLRLCSLASGASLIAGGLALSACGSGAGNLFAEVEPPPEQTQPLALDPGATPSSPNELTPPAPATMSSTEAGELTTGDLPLSGGNPLPNSPPSGGIDPADDPPGDPPGDHPEMGPGLPFVVSVSPEDGATAVEGDTTIVVAFSEPMNQELTEAAYQSEGIPSSSVSFSWSEDGTELTITPNEPLQYATGSDPAEVEARRHSFFISASAADLEGQRLAKPYEFSFSLLRQIDLTFFAVQDRNLSGSFRSNDTYGSQQCARNQVNMCVGDSRVGGDDEQYKGFISFALSELPSSMLRVSQARLNLDITATSGNPFASLGRLMLERANFDVIGLEAFSADSLDVLGPIAASGGAGTTVSADVASPVEAAWRERGMAQFRFRFEDVTDEDNTSDVLLSDWDTQSLDVSYLIP